MVWTIMIKPRKKSILVEVNGIQDEVQRSEVILESVVAAGKCFQFTSQNKNSTNELIISLSSVV